jgi:hypothetical protein
LAGRFVLENRREHHTCTLEELNAVLKELTKADWLRMLNLPESLIPAVLILRGSRNVGRQMKAILPYFSEVLELGTPNGIVEDVLVGDLHGLPVGFACVYGASMASEIVHIFGVLGTRAVIQTGNCGALADGFHAGDLFVAERAYCGEGRQWTASAPAGELTRHQFQSQDMGQPVGGGKANVSFSREES